MTKRIFQAVFSVAMVVLLATLLLAMGVLNRFFETQQREELRSQAALAAQGIQENGLDYLSALETGESRITWIGQDGAVLYDSRVAPERMENHLDREEVHQALETGEGESVRTSASLTERTRYYARRLSDGTVLRLSETQSTTLTLVLAMLEPLLLVALGAAALALLLAGGLSRRIVGPLNRMDLDKPAAGGQYPELTPLLDRLDSQKIELLRRANQLRRTREELETIIDNMNEGLVLLNEKGLVLSMNHRAAQLLNGGESQTGESVYAMNCPAEVLELIDAARGGISTERTIDRGEGRFRFYTSPVVTDSAVTGVALISFDVTEKEKSELMRREFTANVSHELKTPLHSISGCAELLKNGMVKPEDTERFAGMIYSEAQRLILLVEDIIRLSRLDEGGDALPMEKTDLRPLAEEALRELRGEALAARVTLSQEGGSAWVQGVPQLLGGMIFNLCDNAVKYNRPGGSVAVLTGEEGGEPFLTVRDTGIGIPPEHQDRIFERFYRVDKSHSKRVGGTGLGLSIVKHTALLHNARIQLKSSPGAGTEIRVIFPKAG